MDDLDLRPTEDRLRAGLRSRAGRIDPPDRLDDVLDGIAADGRASRWLPLAAAATVAAVVAGLWFARPDPAPPAPSPAAESPAPTPSASPQPTTATSPSPTATPSPTPTGSSSVAPSAAAPLPVYVVAAEVLADPDGRYGLRRVWRPTTTTDEADRVREAVEASLTLPPVDLTRGPWRDVHVLDVEVAADGVVVTLSGPPTPTATDADGLALPAVGWTAQAVLGRGNLPVTVRADGKTLGVVTRPATDESWTVLADVWVTTPTPDAVVDGGSPVVVRGEATAFEAALSWELARGGSAVRSGHVTASAGAPARGTFTVDLGRLGPGTYSVRVTENSAEDGHVVADDVVTFRVR